MTTMYIALDEDLLIARGRDGHWEANARLVGLNPRCLAIDPHLPKRVYCGTAGHGLWRSADAGSSWERAGQGIAHREVTAVAVSPHPQAGGSGMVYAGTEPSALFRSADGGDTWQELPGLRALPSAPTWSFPPRPQTSHVRWITPDVADAGRLYVCIEAGALVRSFDGGATWLDRVPDGPRDTHTLVMHPRLPGRLYSAAGDGIMRPGRDANERRKGGSTRAPLWTFLSPTSPAGYNESRDGGSTWEQPDEGLEHHYLWSVAVDPGDADAIVVSAAASPRAAHDAAYAASAVYRRTGNGPWQQVHDGLPPAEGTTVAVLATNQSEPGVFYAASNRGVYRSSDAGSSWEQLAVTLPYGHHYQRLGALVVTDDVRA